MTPPVKSVKPVKPVRKRNEEGFMPKMKTHRGIAKRVKVTGSGRVRRSQASRGHNRLAKGKDTFRRRRNDADLAPGDAKVVKRMLGQ
jgi:large subunit ribosomal protein L35